MAIKSRHKQVTWKVDRAVAPTLHPRNYVADVILDPEHEKLLEGQLEPGNLFFVKGDLTTRSGIGYLPDPHPYLVETWYDPMFKSGTFAIYAGTVRVEERKGSGLLRAKRHSFIINGCRYLTINLNHFTPANIDTTQQLAVAPQI